MRTLNLGILAHVDAGKTSLTERLLLGAGIVDELGSVDAGSTHTDFLDLERQRGITIKAAVVSFEIGDTTINLIDTPGHPDFIAEVERALQVLSGAVLVISAVEGVQAQTRVLFRTLQRLRIPTLLYVNKIDRLGADEKTVLRAIEDKLSPSIVPMGTTWDAGTRGAEFRPYREDELDLTAVAVHDLPLDAGSVTALTKQARVFPVFFGSAITGAGVDVLTEGLTELLPAIRPDADGPLAGTVFKIDRGPAGDRVAFVRLFGGTIRVRDRIGDQTVTNIEVFERGTTVRRTCAVGGEIAKVWGLGDVRIGDVVGERRGSAGEHHFAPPTLETVVVAEDRRRLHAALAQLAEQDPLIGLRQDEVRQELSLSLYGEVQKEVIQATLLSDFDLDVEFRETTPICIERLTGSGEAIQRIPRKRTSAHPFFAGVGLRVDPAPIGSGVEFRYETELGALPSAFMTAIADTVPEALSQGLHGWSVTDCTVTLTHSAYYPRQSHAHQGFSKAMSSIGSDFRYTVPLVLLDAVRRAGTVVCEPISRYELEIPGDVLPVMIPLLAKLEAPPLEQTTRGDALVLSGQIRAASVHALQILIPDITRGEGVLETSFDSFRPVRGIPPERLRTDLNPLNREEYLMRVLGVTG
jgi:ribosomal protection tetracycline resistance protein